MSVTSYRFLIAAVVAVILPVTAGAAKKPAPTPAPPAATSPTPAPAPAGSATTPATNAVMPASVSAKYAKETAGKARMHTCLDQYHANKAANANGGLEWIQKGGGYYSVCSKKLKGEPAAAHS